MPKKPVRHPRVEGFLKDERQFHFVFTEQTETVTAEVDTSLAEVRRAVRGQLELAERDRGADRPTFELRLGGRATTLPIDEAIETLNRLVQEIERAA
jgi:hypothetical protein